MPNKRPVSEVTPKFLLTMVSDEYLIAIGRVITQWSLMEEMLGATIWQASMLRNDFGRILMAQMQVQSKLDALTALLRQIRPPLGEQMHNVTCFVREHLVGPRNLAAHGVWTTHDVVPLAFVTKMAAKGRLTEQGRTPIALAELESVAQDIAEITAWLMKANNLLPALRQRPGGLGHTTPEPRNPQGYANMKSRALQPPTSRRKLEAPKPPKPKKRGGRGAKAKPRPPHP